MALPAPILDERNAAHLARQLALLLRQYVPEWPGVRIERDAAGGGERAVVDDPQARALIAVFARYAELIIERLNRVPGKNLLAFLDLLGAAQTPPQPARVPLTFRLAEGGTVPARVPAGTQVAAAAPAADGAPVIFETERDLVVTPARLAAAIVHDPAQDRYRDLGPALARRVAGGLPAFEGEAPMPHEFYVDIEPFATVQRFDTLSLFMEFERAAEPTPLPVAWDVWDGAGGLAAEHGDGSRSMSEWGGFHFTNLVPPPRCSVGGVEGRWLRCRLTSPVPAAQLPGPFSSLRIESSVRLEEVAVEHACADAQVLDLGQPFYPFGERPRFGSTLYLASALFGRVVSSQPVSLGFTVSDPRRYVAETPGLQVIPDPRPKPELAWERWAGDAWVPMAGVVDGTGAFTASGSITLQASSEDGPARPCSVNGIEGCWVRARIVRGDYGREVVYKPVRDAADKLVSYEAQPATLVAPSIARPTVTLTIGPGGYVRRVVTHNQLRHRLFESAGTGPECRPFEMYAGTRPALHLGFELPEGSDGFPGDAVSLHTAVTRPPAGASPGADTLPPRIAWERRDASGWSGLVVRDDTQAFSRSGAVEWLPPDGMAATFEFGERPLHWIRARWVEGDWRSPARLELLLIDTVTALQCMTIAGEVLGSGDGGKSQRYACSHAPVFAGTQLQVREPERPSPVELEALRAAGETVSMPAAGEGSEVWVPWQEVADFHASGPRDRHYVLDSLKGEIRFGDGAHGLAPPRGSGNIRLTRYRSGGGARGNLPEHSVTQLLTTIAYVDGVTHALPAEGGADAETVEALLERAPRGVRHGDRAVTREDFEDLAQLASPEVARVKCVPLWDALSTPLFLDSKRDGLREPGCLTLIVVPRSTDARPMPSRELVDRVRSHLDARRLATAALYIVGPRYLQVDVEAEIVPVSLEAAGGLEGTVARALAAFLHPLTGGVDGDGWPWGRRPHESDFHRCIGAVPGVDHVHGLTVTERPEIEDLTDTDHFLVHSGTHRVRLRAAGPVTS